MTWSVVIKEERVLSFVTHSFHLIIITKTTDRSSYPASKPGLCVVRCHAQSLDKELHCLINAVLVVEAQATNVQGVCIRRINSENITVKDTFIRDTHQQLNRQKMQWLKSGDTELRCSIVDYQAQNGEKLSTLPRTGLLGSGPAGPDTRPWGSWSDGRQRPLLKPDPYRTPPKKQLTTTHINGHTFFWTRLYSNYLIQDWRVFLPAFLTYTIPCIQRLLLHLQTMFIAMHSSFPGCNYSDRSEYLSEIPLFKAETCHLFKLQQVFCRLILKAKDHKSALCLQMKLTISVEAKSALFWIRTSLWASLLLGSSSKTFWKQRMAATALPNDRWHLPSRRWPCWTRVTNLLREPSHAHVNAFF